MELTRDIPPDGINQIERYAPNGITIGGEIYAHGLILTLETITSWEPTHVEALAPEDFLPILALAPSILIIGTGPKQVLIENSLLADCINQGMGIEVMSTDAACRTFNILAAEKRNLVAALLP